MKVSSFWHKKCCDFFLVESCAPLPHFVHALLKQKSKLFAMSARMFTANFRRRLLRSRWRVYARRCTLPASKGGFRGRHCICEMQRTLYVVLVCISSLHIVLWIPSAVFCSTGPRHLANWSAYMRPIYLLEGRLVARYFSRAKCRFATILGRYWLRSTTDA